MKTVGARLAGSWLGLGMLLLGISGGRLDAAKPPHPGPMVGKAAPDFRMQGIYDESYSLETFKGHILVMQFGTSW